VSSIDDERCGCTDLDSRANSRSCNVSAACDDTHTHTHARARARVHGHTESECNVNNITRHTTCLCRRDAELFELLRGWQQERAHALAQLGGVHGGGARRHEQLICAHLCITRHSVKQR
jgi:hypothetical protein